MGEGEEEVGGGLGTAMPGAGSGQPGAGGAAEKAVPSSPEAAAAPPADGESALAAGETVGAGLPTGEQHHLAGMSRGRRRRLGGERGNKAGEEGVGGVSLETGRECFQAEGVIRVFSMVFWPRNAEVIVKYHKLAPVFLCFSRRNKYLARCVQVAV